MMLERFVKIAMMMSRTMGYLISFAAGLAFAYGAAWVNLGKRPDILGSLRALRRPSGPLQGSKEYLEGRRPGFSSRNLYEQARWRIRK